MNARGALVTLLVAAASTAVSCHASPPELPPAPSATADVWMVTANDQPTFRGFGP